MTIIYKLRDIHEAAAKCLGAIDGNRVAAFHGEMGAGKTTLIHAICDLKGVLNTVSSPTFAIVNEYVSSTENIYHIDLFRMNNEEEARRAGAEDYLYSGNLCLVEWPEKAPGIFPNETAHIYISIVDEKTRKIDV